MNPVAMEPIGGAGQGMGKGEIGPPGANAEAENSGNERKPVKSYCIDAYEDGTYSASGEQPEAEEAAEGEDAAAAPAPAEGDEGDANEGGPSLGEGLSLPDALMAVVKAEKSRLSGGESAAQAKMDEGFASQGGGAVHG